MKLSIIVFRVVQYFKYWLLRMDEHSLQGPYLYNLYTKVLKPQNQPNISEEIEQIRAQLSLDQNAVIQKYGAYMDNHKNTRISAIVKGGVSGIVESNLLKALATSIEAKNVLELGTSVGLNAISMTSNTSYNTVSIEVDNSLFTIAKDVVRRVGLSDQIELVNTDAKEALQKLILEGRNFDLVFIDANHTYDATIKYFELVQKLLPKSGILVFDDINWSPDMNKAWSEIKSKLSDGLIIENFNKGIWLKSHRDKKEYILNF